MTEAILNIREIVEKEAARAVDKCLSERINQKTAEECMKSKFKITPEGNLTFETVAESVLEAKNPKAAEEFTKCIAKMLSKNGVKVMMTEYEYNGGYGVAFEGLDFSEHDKVLKSEILKLKEKVEDCEEDFEIAARECDKLYAENQSLKQRIAELESMEMENFSDIDTSSPLACAESLIEHMTHCEKFMFMPERDVQTFSVEELKEIADYLMVYYKHHKDRDAEETISF